MEKRGRKKKVVGGSINFSPPAVSSPTVKRSNKVTKEQVQDAFRKEKIREANAFFSDLKEKIEASFAAAQFQMAPRWEWAYVHFTGKENESSSSSSVSSISEITAKVDSLSSAKKQVSFPNARGPSRRSVSETREKRPSPLGEVTGYDGEFKRPNIALSTAKKRPKRSSSTSRLAYSDLNLKTSQSYEVRRYKLGEFYLPELKTPSSKLVTPVALVTPLSRSKGPINVFRRPQAGEVVVSLNGSPLLVSTENVRRPQLTLPVDAGEKILSILPLNGNSGMVPRVMEENLKEDLRSLQDMISKMID